MKSLLFSLFLFFSSGILLQSAAETKTPDHFPACPGKYITDGILASDGTLWVTTEGQGVYRLNPEGNYSGEWFHAGYYAHYPETENYYAIAEDKQGRIWVGTDNKGVAVFNGTNWKTYDRENALPGDRVFDIAVSPASGEVAIATSGGIAIYNPSGETWRDLTRADGLAEDQVEALDFSPDGKLWIAYQCGGVSMASPGDQYKKIRTEQAPWYRDSQKRLRQPAAPKGNGLPSNLCNAVNADSNGNVWVGTTCGLGYSLQGRSWQFIRGADYGAKNKGVYGINSRAGTSRKSSLLPEDFITCLTATNEGLWAGFRNQGAALIDPGSMNIVAHLPTSKTPGVKCGWVTSIIPFPDGNVSATTYGGGLVTLRKGKGTWEDSVFHKKTGCSHPVPPPPPTMEQLDALLNQLAAQRLASKTPSAVYWKEDWTTQGDWCERYGRDYAVLCAANAPWENGTYYDHFRAAAGQTAIKGYIGPHKTHDDALRHWVHWVSAPDNRNVLFGPDASIRTEAEWDDHGESYARSFDGPDMWVAVKVPEGGGEITLYFYNPNGHTPTGSNRDYFLEIRKARSPYAETPLVQLDWLDIAEKSKKGKSTQSQYEKIFDQVIDLPVLARARIKDFAGSGVYKSFAVNDPGFYYVRVCRNNSFNTILNGVFLTAARPSRQRLFVPYADIPMKPKPDRNIVEKHKRLAQLWNKSMQAAGHPAAALSALGRYKLLVYRFLSGEPDADLAYWRWGLNLWKPEDREHFDRVMEKSWHDRQAKNPFLRSAEWSRHSPHTIPFGVEETEAMEEMGIGWEQFLPEHFPSAGMVNETKRKIHEYMNKRQSS